VSLYIRGPEKICIIGKNGCGKTTLLRKIAEELMERKDLKVSYMPQNYEELLAVNQTPIEFLTVTGSKEEYSRIRTYLGSMKYTPDEMTHLIADLSGGQKAKLLLLQMSMSGSNVLILDEPTRNFSPLSNPVIRHMLQGFGGVILSISHDRKYLEEVAEKVYELTEKGLELKKE
ncbi:MAG: ABC-F family ATP-binding cassette domain-containing protein, partial [Agathobacter sp.]|nr:ABC-F family ATP-binding cassette domain-containing protein [Agathobacter sp.]